MTRVSQILQDVKVAAFDFKVRALAERSGVHEDVVRRMLKSTPAAIQNLEKLEKAVADLRAEQTTT